MFENIGKKCKKLAKFTCVSGCLISIILAILMIQAGWMYDRRYTIGGFLVLILGPLAFWIESWTLYAIGEAAEQSKINSENIKVLLEKNGMAYQTEVTKNTINLKDKLERSDLQDKKEYAKELYENELITKDEYEGIK